MIKSVDTEFTCLLSIDDAGDPLAAWLVLDSGDLTRSELSKRVNRDCSTLSTAAKLLEGKAQTDTELRGLMKKMREELFEIQISKAPRALPYLWGFFEAKKLTI